MVINRIKMVNFMGLKGVTDIIMPHIAALVGKNGMGKTTIINGIRYALTGDEPEGDIINKSADTCSVSLYINDDDGTEVEFTRIKRREKPSKCEINGKATTQKTMNEKIESIIGIGLDKVKVLASSEVVAAMKPQEFSSFILDYIPEKITCDEIIGLIPESTLGMVEICEANLHDGINLQILNDFADMLTHNRKYLKKELAEKTLLYDGKPKEAPTFTRDEIQRQLKVLDNMDNERKMYAVKKVAYDKAVANLNKHNQMLAQLRQQLSELKAERPNPAQISAAKDKEKSLTESLQNQKVTLHGVTSALKQLEVTLEALNKPICPVSPLITCHTDKSVAKEEISESIAATREGMAAMEVEIKKAETELAEVRHSIEILNANAVLYDRKIALAKQIKTMEDNTPDIPARPEEIDVADTAAERASLNAIIKSIDAYEEGQKLAVQIERLKGDVADYEALVKAVSEKGPVRTGVISKYLGVFEGICNKRSTKLRPEIDFKFVSDNGVVVLMNNGKGDYLPYESLSGGEKVYMLFVLMDMLNALCGSNILLLDELSVIDTECFNALLDIVLAYAGDYDHVILAAVDHTDTVESIKKRGIPNLTFGSGVELAFASA